VLASEPCVQIHDLFINGRDRWPGFVEEPGRRYGAVASRKIQGRSGLGSASVSRGGAGPGSCDVWILTNRHNGWITTDTAR